MRHLFYWLPVLLVLDSVLSRGELYLYDVGGNEHRPVIDYPVQNIELPEGQVERPDFLYSTDSGHRVVEFYAPWCPHCRHFKDHYIQFARTMSGLARQYNTHIDIYAVSCVAHKPLCRRQNVTGYPMIKIYPAGSIQPVVTNYWSLHPFQVLRSFGIQADEMTLADEMEEAPVEPKLRQSKSAVYKRRSKEDVFSDAYASFTFAMQTAIFMEDGPLNDKARKALSQWLQLLQKTLPPAWKLQALIGALLDDFQAIADSEDALLAIVDKFAPEKPKWSPSCTKGDDMAGYTCGLWELFHIMTVGLVEWNSFASEDHGRIRTLEAADTLRDYIDNFFGCDVCRINFLHAYEACSHDRCNRLISEPGKFHEWIQFPLWLFETHNSVNARLMREKAEREKREPSHQDEMDSQWPSRAQCSRCWLDDERWDENVITKLLRLEYWPDDEASKNIRDQIFDKTTEHWEVEEAEQSDDDVSRAPPPIVLLPLGVVTCLIFTWYQRRVDMYRSGLHKKRDEAAPGFC